MYFPKIFCQLVSYPVILLTMSFLQQKLFWHHFFFLSWIMLLVLYWKTHCQMKAHLGVLPFSFSSFIALYVTFRNVPFELTFVSWKVYIEAFFSVCGCHLFQHIYWKDYLFSIELPLLLCQVSIDYICMTLFLFHWWLCLFFPQYHTCLDYYNC